MKTPRRKFGRLTKVNFVNQKALFLKKQNMCHLVLVTQKTPIAPSHTYNVSYRHETAQSLRITSNYLKYWWRQPRDALCRLYAGEL